MNGETECLEHGIEANHDGCSAVGIILREWRLPEEAQGYLRGNVIVEPNVSYLNPEIRELLKEFWFEGMARVWLVELDAIIGMDHEYILEEEGKIAHKVVGIHFCRKVPVCSGIDVHAGCKRVDTDLKLACRDVVVTELSAKKVGNTSFATDLDGVGKVHVDTSGKAYGIMVLVAKRQGKELVWIVVLTGCDRATNLKEWYQEEVFPFILIGIHRIGMAPVEEHANVFDRELIEIIDVITDFVHDLLVGAHQIFIDVLFGQAWIKAIATGCIAEAVDHIAACIAGC